MLGGIYFVHGYGGKEKFDEIMRSAGTDDKDLVAAGREYLILPFKPSDPGNPGGMLSRAWDIKNEEGLTQTLDKLKAHSMESSYTKAWDYARYVNVVCLAYAANMVTETEAKKLVAEVLPLAQQDYKNWNDYMADFAAGRSKWDNEQSEDLAAFTELSKTITTGDKNIYTLLPLN